jgi:hypothetical protein
MFRRLSYFEFHIYWIPSHVGVVENEFVDQRAHACASDAFGAAFSLSIVSLPSSGQISTLQVLWISISGFPIH